MITPFPDGTKMFAFPRDEGDEEEQVVVNHVVNIQTYDGKSYVVFLDEDSTPHSLKEYVSSQTADDNLNVSCSRFVYSGFALPETLLLCSIVTPHSTLFLVPSVSELISYFLISVSRHTSLTASADTSVRSLKNDVCELMGRTELSENTVIKWNNKELHDCESLSTCGIDRSSQVCVIVRDSDSLLCDTYRQRLQSNDICTMIRRAESGVSSGRKPELIEDCTGGTYIVKDAQGNNVGIFKPVDEEPYAPANPKGFIGDSMYVHSKMKRGIPVGESCTRECIAYLLDRDSFAGVPHTVVLRILDTSYEGGQLHLNFKNGSLQRFVSDATSAEDYGPADFPVRDVHRIGIMDIRLVNTDRHTGNILINESDSGELHLIPIDHAYILPHYRCLDEVNHEWLFWPQAKKPFGEEELKFIESLDPEQDALMVTTSYPLANTYLLTLMIGTFLIKIGAKKGLTLYQIGRLFLRNGVSESSLERLIAKTESLLKGSSRMDLASSQSFSLGQTMTPSSDEDEPQQADDEDGDAKKGTEKSAHPVPKDERQQSANLGASDDSRDVQENINFCSVFTRLLEQSLRPDGSVVLD